MKDGSNSMENSEELQVEIPPNLVLSLLFSLLFTIRFSAFPPSSLFHCLLISTAKHFLSVPFSSIYLLFHDRPSLLLLDLVCSNVALFYDILFFPLRFLDRNIAVYVINVYQHLIIIVYGSISVWENSIINTSWHFY